MVMNRRSFLKGIAGAVGAAIILPPTVEQVAAEVRRTYYALDSTMLGNAGIIDVWEQDFLPDPQGMMSVRQAWAQMGFRVGDMVRIADYQDLAVPTPRQARDLYRIERVDWGDGSAESVSRVERYFDSAKFRELLA
jgi:hypothetical protein